MKKKQTRHHLKTPEGKKVRSKLRKMKPDIVRNGLCGLEVAQILTKELGFTVTRSNVVTQANKLPRASRPKLTSWVPKRLRVEGAKPPAKARIAASPATKDALASSMLEAAVKLLNAAVAMTNGKPHD
jgi:hypothetical protein